MKAIYLRDTYDKTNGSFVGDIAIIVLQRTVTISHVVAPVCVNWNKKYTTIPNGSFGMVKLLYNYLWYFIILYILLLLIIIFWHNSKLKENGRGICKLNVRVKNKGNLIKNLKTKKIK